MRSYAMAPEQTYMHATNINLPQILKPRQVKTKYKPACNNK